MFDRHINKVIDKPLRGIAVELAKMRVTATQLTMIGFIMGIFAFIQIIYGNYILALAFILLNRFFDGIDGKVAQIDSPSDVGGYLDIVMDFIFYFSIPLAFGIALPDSRLAALVLIFSFASNTTAFLTFSIMAEKYQLSNIHYPNKSFYYLGGITEGSETIFLFVLFCLFPSGFNLLAYIFSGLCLLTAIYRIIYSYKTLKQEEKKRKDPRKKIYNQIL